ncbi:unnamed protein product [Prorocentrum cordatum]|uniref:Uncharacterized protein n=2 Tax=Prorocentrum cordatum TaxID=2364126 RepID=A0ABN9TFW1_9DINO|nr:unnamed protein product [Polarella glacialis]
MPHANPYAGGNDRPALGQNGSREYLRAMVSFRLEARRRNNPMDSNVFRSGSRLRDGLAGALACSAPWRRRRRRKEEEEEEEEEVRAPSEDALPLCSPSGAPRLVRSGAPRAALAARAASHSKSSRAAADSDVEFLVPSLDTQLPSETSPLNFFLGGCVPRSSCLGGGAACWSGLA